jgi:hypothetical protein
MMTQINELEQDRHLMMNYVEFLEAFARVADKVQLVSTDDLKYQILESTYDIHEKFESESDSDDVIKEEDEEEPSSDTPLHEKIESLIIIAMFTCLSKNYAKNFLKSL